MLLKSQIGYTCLTSEARKDIQELNRNYQNRKTQKSSKKASLHVWLILSQPTLYLEGKKQQGPSKLQESFLILVNGR